MRPFGASASSARLGFTHAPIHAISSPLHLLSSVGPLVDYSDYYYDISAMDYYCTGGGVACATNAGAPTDTHFGENCSYYGSICPGLNWAGVEIYGPYGSTAGTPSEVYAECDKYTSSGWDSASADVTTSYEYDSSHGVDLGVISGKGTLFNWFQSNPGFPGDAGEGNTAQTSSGSVSVYDTTGLDSYNASSGDQGNRITVTGVQNTNNSDDSLNSGSFSITVTGWIHHMTPHNVQTGTSWGTMSCTAGGPHAGDLYNAGYTGEQYYDYYFEGEFENS